MTKVQDAVARLKAALSTVAALDGRVYDDPGATAGGPAAAVISPPSVEWAGFCGGEPSSASFVVHLVVPFDQYSTARLFELVEPVVKSIADGTPFVVSSASPGLLQQGGTQLPTYAITVDVGL
ncbi:hypothetical protein [Amycolatopsis echigonensis]|uniref:Uncharacterized protein n=1 Tax=Amycolatopsis echigonensis TaxID=2576905 RepID=A0A8E1VXW4_9PSEU|nr:hypothetical protein [Amycolatopsis echigonensis]MBB2500263.1 hypothetical protein [Amycolatopsis echigonensis]